MNKRILELADKAVEDMPSGPWNIPDEFCKKFAELIVRECANVAANHDALDIYEEIREHFGVEE
jgi:hypothetical protein